MVPELVIFDCDGVLVDSEPVAARVLAEALVDLGLDYTVEATDRAFRGRSLADILIEIEEQLGRPVPSDFLDNLERNTQAAFDSSLEPIEGVTSLLEELAERGIDVCVASSGSFKKIQHSLQLTDLTRFFEDRVFSASQVSNGKPAPDLFVFAAEQMGHPIESSWVIEDSLPGARGAVASGAQVIGYASLALSDGPAHRRALEECGAQVIAQMAEARTILGLSGHGMV